MRVSALCLAVLLVGTAATTVVRITFTESRGGLGTCSPGAACDGVTCCMHGVSLSKVRLFSDVAILPIESITNPSGYNRFEEVPSKLIDDLTANSKWLDLNFTTNSYSELIIVVDDSLGAPTSLELVAGNTPDVRDPVSWTVEVLGACGGFSEVLSVTHATAPDLRWSPYPEGPFALRLTPTDANCEKSEAIRFVFTNVKGGAGTDGVMLSEACWPLTCPPTSASWPSARLLPPTPPPGPHPASMP